MKNALLFIFLLGGLATGSLSAQTNPAPEPWASSGVMPSGDAILAAFEINGYPAPAANTTDWVAAVDADDANVLLGFNRADINSSGEFIGAVQVNEPTGASNAFHLVFYDVSEATFHVINDANGEALTIDWVADENGTFIEGYDIGPFGAFPGNGSPNVPGDSDFNTIISLLPVEMTTFTGFYGGKSNNLSWSTASEDGNDFFAVERSANGDRFTEIGRVAGANAAADYVFRDEAPLAGENFYRLRQTDFSGAVEYSELIMVVATEETTTGVSVYPNPAQTEISVSLQGEWKDNVSVQLIDAAGRRVQTWANGNSSLRRMPLPALEPGVYQVVATDGEKQLTSRLVIVR